MKLYRVHTRDSFDESKGYSYHSSKREARKIMATDKGNGFYCELEEIEVTISKPGIIWALNEWGSHPDNG